MREAGLTDIWLTWYKADASRCIGMVHQKRPTFKPLTLVDMSSAGLMLVVGYCVSFIVLTCENIFCLLRNKKKKATVAAAKTQTVSTRIVIDQKDKGNKENADRPNFFFNPQMYRDTKFSRLVGPTLRTIFASCKVKLHYLITNTIRYSTSIV